MIMKELLKSCIRFVEMSCEALKYLILFFHGGDNYEDKYLRTHMVRRSGIT